MARWSVFAVQVQRLPCKQTHTGLVPAPSLDAASSSAALYQTHQVYQVYSNGREMRKCINIILIVRDREAHLYTVNFTRSSGR